MLIYLDTTECFLNLHKYSLSFYSFISWFLKKESRETPLTEQGTVATNLYYLEGAPLAFLYIFSTEKIFNLNI